MVYVYIFSLDIYHSGERNKWDAYCEQHDGLVAFIDGSRICFKKDSPIVIIPEEAYKDKK